MTPVSRALSSGLPAEAQASHAPAAMLVGDEQVLVARIRGGDAAAFEQTVRAFIVPLTAFAESQLHNADEARDVVQDVLSRVWLRRTTWQPATVGGYLYGAVRNAALNVLKHATVEQRFADHTIRATPNEPSAEPPELPDERLSAVRQALTGLTDRQRLAIQLRFARSLTMTEVAATLGIRQGAAEKLVARALVAVRSAVRGR